MIPWWKACAPRGLFSSCLILGMCFLGNFGSAYAAGHSMFSLGTDTGEKPQSKIWYHDGSYWAILDGPSGVAFYRQQEDEDWERGNFSDAVLTGSGAADVKWNGTDLFVLVHGSSTKLYKYSYDDDDGSWDKRSGFPVNVPRASGTETVVIDQDGSGRLWATSCGSGKVQVAYTETSDHRDWSNGFTLRSGINSDDISSIVAFDEDGKVGVVWSDQNRDEFGFRYHDPSDDPDEWSDTEVVDSGNGCADDHINLAADRSGRVYALTKDDSNRSHLHRRSSSGSWTTKRNVSGGSSTRGIVMVADDDNKVYVLYTNWDASPDRIDYRSASLSSLSFSGATNFLSSGESINNVTGMKQPLPEGSLIAIATKGDDTGWWNGFGSPPEGLPDPEPPTDLVATLHLTPATVELEWDTPSTGPPDGYRVERQVDGGSFSAIGGLVSGTSFVDEAPPEDVLCYRVRAETGGDETAATSPACVDNTPLPPPTEPLAVAATHLPWDQTVVFFEAHFDEGEGQTINDLSGVGNHASRGDHRLAEGNDPSWRSDGMLGSCLDFDGNDDSVRVPDHASLSPSGSFTFEAWVRRDDDVNGTLLSKGENGERTYRVRVSSSGSVEFLWENSSGANQEVVTDEVLAMDTWHHVACVFDADLEENRVYVDGRLRGSDATEGLPATNDHDVHLGIKPPDSRGFEGRIDLVRLSHAAIYVDEFRPPTDFDDRGHVHLQWSPPLGGGTADWYHVECSTNGGPYVRVTLEPLLTTSFVDAAPPGDDVCYRIVASNERGLEGPPSASMCASVPAPAERTSTPETFQVTSNTNPPPRTLLTWNSVPHAVGFHVYRGEDSEALFRMTSTPISATELTDPGAGANRCYEIRAVDALGREGPASEVRCAILLPHPPLPPEEATASPELMEGPSAGVAAFSFDEAAGQLVHDASTFGAHGELGNTDEADSNDPTWVPGIVGTALEFDGNDFVLIPASAQHAIAGSFTVEAWVRLTGDDEHCVLSKGATQARNYWILLDQDGTVDFRWETQSGSNHGAIATSGGIEDDEWHHVACVYDMAGGESRIYVDGRLIETEPDSGTPVTTDDPVYIGARKSGAGLSDDFEGEIDLVRISADAIYSSNFEPPLSYGGPPVPVIRVSWSAPDIGLVTEYRVERSLEGSPWQEATLLEASALTWTDPEPSLGEACYRIRAVDGFGQISPPSLAACLLAPTDTPEASEVGPAEWGLWPWPNPASNSLRISFAVPGRGHANLSIYDVRGARVANLLSGPLDAGTHRAVWNGRSDAGQRVASGVYFLVLRQNQGETIRRVTLLR